MAAVITKAHDQEIQPAAKLFLTSYNSFVISYTYDKCKDDLQTPSSKFHKKELRKTCTKLSHTADSNKYIGITDKVIIMCLDSSSVSSVYSPVFNKLPCYIFFASV